MKIAVAMSGGVDSSTAAALLAEAGHEVIGLFMATGVSSGTEGGSQRRCCSLNDARDAQRVADRLGVPFYRLNYQHHFARIIEDFVSEYREGRTPNPCVRCNQWLKFDALWETARGLGIEAIATGHYARLEQTGSGPKLLRAADARKDQSYFLFAVPPALLARTLFPVGALDKDQVRAIARKHRLPVSEKPESQDICFVPKGDYREVLNHSGSDDGQEGPIEDLHGNRMGTHRGIQNYTVGQRRGLGVAAGRPMYVIRIDAQANRIVVGPEEDLLNETCLVEEIRWIAEPSTEPLEFEAEVKIRYAHPPARAAIIPRGNRAEVRFAAPQKAVTPGQAAVFYRGDEVLGGGWITSNPLTSPAR
jgi:tRNA-specific 2-thiouridylase